MNNLNKHLPNEIIDIIAKKLHESIMLDLHEEFKEVVERNKNRRMCFTCAATDDYCGTADARGKPCWKDFEPEEEFDSLMYFYKQCSYTHSIPDGHFWFNGELLSTGYFGDTSASEGEDTDSD